MRPKHIGKQILAGLLLCILVCTQSVFAAENLPPVTNINQEESSIDNNHNIEMSSGSEDVGDPDSESLKESTEKENLSLEEEGGTEIMNGERETDSQEDSHETQTAESEIQNQLDETESASETNTPDSETNNTDSESFEILRNIPVFSSRRLIVGTDNPSIFKKQDEILSDFNGLYLLQFKTEKEARESYLYYLEKADLVEVDTGIEIADQEAGGASTSGSSSLGSAMTSESNPFSDLSEQLEAEQEEKEQAETAGGTYTEQKYDVALLDTGAPEESGIDGISLIGEDVKDDNGHGTRMAEMILAQNPEARILSIKVLDENGKGDISAVYAGLEYAILHNIPVINLSMSARATQENSILEEAIRNDIAGNDNDEKRNILVVGAAGNNGKNTKYFIPGRIEEALIAGACDAEGKRLELSNWGETVDVNVVSESTSDAAATLSGWLTLHKKTEIRDVLNQGTMFSPDFESDLVSDTNEQETISPEEEDFSITATTWSQSQLVIPYTGGKKVSATLPENGTLANSLVNFTKNSRLKNTTATGLSSCYIDPYDDKIDITKAWYFSIPSGFSTAVNGKKIKYEYDDYDVVITLKATYNSSSVTHYGSLYEDSPSIVSNEAIWKNSTATTILHPQVTPLTSGTDCRLYIGMHVDLFKHGTAKRVSISNLYNYFADIDSTQSLRRNNEPISSSNSFIKDKNSFDTNKPGWGSDDKFTKIITSGSNSGDIYSEYTVSVSNGVVTSVTNDGDWVQNIFSKNTKMSTEGMDLTYGTGARSGTLQIGFRAPRTNVYYVADTGGSVQRINSNETDLLSDGQIREYVFIEDTPVYGANPVPNDGYRFAGWTVNKTCTLEDGTVLEPGSALTMDQIKKAVVTDPLTFTAHFQKKTGSFAVSKTVEGTDAADEFTFTLNLKDGETNLSGTFPYTVNGGSRGTLTFNNQGKATLKLKGGETAIIEEIPQGGNVKYTVTEAENASYSTSSKNAADQLVGLNRLSGVPEIQLLSSGTGDQAEGTWSRRGLTSDTSKAKRTINHPSSFAFNSVKNAVKFVKTEVTNSNLSIIQSNIPLVSGTQYTLSFWAWGSGTLSAWVGSSPYGNADTASKNVTVSKTWKKYTMDFKAGEDCTLENGKASAIFGIRKDNLTEELWIADMRLEPKRTAEFTNTFKTGAFGIRNEVYELNTGKLKLTKTVEGTGSQDPDFTFKFSLKDASGSALTDSFSYTGSKSGTIKHNGTVKLKKGQNILIAGLPAGTRYMITEEEIENYIPDENPISGQISSVSTSGTASRPFTYTVTITDSAGGPAKGLKLYDASMTAVRATTDANGQFTWTRKGGQYTNFYGIPVGYKYAVSQQGVNGYTHSNTLNARGTISEVLITNEWHNKYNPLQENADFLNEYSPSGITAVIQAGKRLDAGGRVLKDKEFSFGLYSSASASSPMKTAKNNAAGVIKFKMNYDAAGTHTYYIREIPGTEEGMNYDASVYRAVVKIANQGGKLTAQVSYPDGTPDFVNSFESHSLTVRKNVTGNMGNKSEEFDFTLSLQNTETDVENGTFPYSKGTENGIVSVNDGRCLFLPEGSSEPFESFSLSHGESIQIRGIPFKTVYQVMEMRADRDGYVTTVDGAASGELNADTAVQFTNRRGATIPTGVKTFLWSGFSILVSMCIVGFTLRFLRFRRKREEK